MSTHYAVTVSFTSLPIEKGNSDPHIAPGIWTSYAINKFFSWSVPQIMWLIVCSEYPRTQQQYVFTSHTVGTVTERVCSFLYILIWHSSQLASLGYHSHQNFEYTPNEHLIFMLPLQTYMQYFGLSQRKLFLLWGYLWNSVKLWLLIKRYYCLSLPIHTTWIEAHTSIHFILFYLFPSTDSSLLSRWF
jgi:hypothetical protein